MSLCVVIRTHGGLGNQLFQLLYGRLLSSFYDANFYETHDARYSHAFSRSTCLSLASEPSPFQRIVSFARIPKILQHIFNYEEKPFRLGNTIYLDGYFQNMSIYEQFKKNEISKELERFARELNIIPANLDETLIHLRAGDFFSSFEESKKHIVERIGNVPEGSHVMTNDELLLESSDIAKLMIERNLKLISTKNMLSEDVLRVMSCYKKIDANESTLTFWASVLAGCHVQFMNKNLNNCKNFFLSHR